MASPPPDGHQKGRGAISNPANRFFSTRSTREDDGWHSPEASTPRLKTCVTVQQSRRIISRNDSPDVPFEQSINPYQGCEHGCIYCFARPTHAYLDLSPGLDFETRLFAKPDAARLLRRELGNPRYTVRPITIGANTDPYQPIERDWKITRSLLEVMLEARHPVSLITKNALVLRDLDLLQDLAALKLVKVMLSVTSLDPTLTQLMEPRASAPHRRLAAITTLADAGVPVGVLVAPLIPFLNDAEMESILAAVSTAGARSAGYVLLRLPLEVRELFREWLATHFPLKAARIMETLRDARGGNDYDSRYGHRMRGQGPYAELLSQRFRRAARQHGLDNRSLTLDTSLFRPPLRDGEATENQLALF